MMKQNKAGLTNTINCLWRWKAMGAKQHLEQKNFRKRQLTHSLPPTTVVVFTVTVVV